jgi:hypothetical protein
MEPELARRIVHGLRDADISFISLKIRWSTNIVLSDIWNEPKAKKFSKATYDRDIAGQLLPDNLTPSPLVVI